jgi:hypothetical protein
LLCGEISPGLETDFIGQGEEMREASAHDERRRKEAKKAQDREPHGGDRKAPRHFAMSGSVQA